MDRDVQAVSSLRWRWLREPEFWLLLALACAIYLPRLTQLSMRGEESRRAQVAAEILRTGDWIVPRQQGEVYLSRPPLGSWPIALVGMARGEVDLFAARLPSATATILTCLLIYVYSRRWLGKVGALSAGIAYATMAQVLELGMLAETESTLTLLVAASLFVWHAGYASQRRSVWPWVIGYAFAALAGLTKGPQGPIYFVAVTSIYLWSRRDFREWLSWRHAAGVATFAAMLLAWQIPFTLRTDLVSTRDIWLDNATERFTDSSWLPFLKHLASYPVEVAACMLPWSLMLIAFAYPGLRRRLDHTAPLVRFQWIALAVTFPSCWLAVTARGRYFMPLDPCVAVLVGVAIDRIVYFAPEAQLSYALKRFLWPMAVILPAIGVLLTVTGMLNDSATRAWVAATDSPVMSVCFTLAATLGGWLVARAAREVTPERVRWAMLAIGGFIGFAYMGPVTNVRIAHSEDTVRQIAELKELLPRDAETPLVSLGRVHHLFAFHFRDAIPMVAQHSELSSIVETGEYFCFDLPGARQPPELPFAWERVAVISCERNRSKDPEQKVIVGRRLAGSSQTAGRGADGERK
jgi:4-amino-4-deoxy-L-arabinose transferase-like glycosyltransferase